jgi:zinc protease
MIDLLGRRPASEAEVEKVKTQTILELPGSMETLNALGGMIIDLLQFRLPDDYYQTYVRQVEAIGPAEVNRAAPRLLDAAKTIWVVVGDRSKIESEIRSLDFGELRSVDADGHPAKKG